jgi:L-amino acid N-acyltransferase YncA
MAARKPPSVALPVVRPAAPDDAVGIVALLAAVSAEGWLGIDGALHTPEEERAALAVASVRGSGFAVWVAEEAGAIVGHLLLARLPGAARRHVADVAVAVAADARGRGLGGALLDAALCWASTEGLAKVTASVFADNRAALGLFGSRGFVQEGLRRQQFCVAGEWRDEVLLARFLG